MTRDGSKREAAIAALAEVFRERGYEGASLAALSEASGLGKASLYHFFPKGKEEMLGSRARQYRRLVRGRDLLRLGRGQPTPPWRSPPCSTRLTPISPPGGVCAWSAPWRWMRRGTGLPRPVQHYFSRWVVALAGALVRRGTGRQRGAGACRRGDCRHSRRYVLSRALDDAGLFGRVLARLRATAGDRAGATMARGRSL